MLHPEHRRDTDSLLWNPSCRHLALLVRLYSKSGLPLVVLELLTVVGDELKTVITNLILVLDVNILFYESCYGYDIKKGYFDCCECSKKNKHSLTLSVVFRVQNTRNNRVRFL